MRKLSMVSASIAATLALSACQPAAKEEPAETKSEAPATPAAAESAKETEATAPDSSEGTEHTGGPKVDQ